MKSLTRVLDLLLHKVLRVNRHRRSGGSGAHLHLLLSSSSSSSSGVPLLLLSHPSSSSSSGALLHLLHLLHLHHPTPWSNHKHGALLLLRGILLYPESSQASHPLTLQCKKLCNSKCLKHQAHLPSMRRLSRRGLSRRLHSLVSSSNSSPSSRNGILISLVSSCSSPKCLPLLRGCLCPTHLPLNLQTRCSSLLPL